MTKQQIRKQVLIKREQLTSEEVSLLSYKIFNSLTPLLLQYKNFFIYNSFKNEVETKQIIKFLIQNKKNVYLPKIKNGKIFAVKFSNDMKKNNYGIDEPNGEKIEISNFVSIIPAIVLDKQGNRIGFGKGYYDRFLKENECLKVALCYDFQLFDKIPSEEHDVKMDYIITPTRLINCHLSLNKAFNCP